MFCFSLIFLPVFFIISALLFVKHTNPSPASIVTLLFVPGAGCMPKFEAINTISLRHQFLFASSPLTFSTNDVLCKSKLEDMLENKFQGTQHLICMRHRPEVRNNVSWLGIHDYGIILVKLIKIQRSKCFHIDIKAGSRGVVPTVTFPILTLLYTCNCVHVKILAGQRLFLSVWHNQSSQQLFQRSVGLCSVPL